ncbi:hypothetical protein NQ317_016391 [Molorchus minor]|uniref:Tyr recombinase domain-containing protein n=1 Tax=Molorchus minor TaxID=1323400 RepID=A0ABQ9JJI5_9CUCU|nr:hypothetical protein NQ317_016391 [Molorchus minor]
MSSNINYSPEGSESIPEEIEEAATRATLDFAKEKDIVQKIFTRQNIDKFIADAPDDKYLMFKVVALMGILGACRREKLCQMSLNNIEDLGNTLVVNIPDSKTRVSRTFTVITETYIDFVSTQH